MSPTAEELLKQALNLGENDRASVAGALIESLHQEVDPDVEEAWDTEIRRRVEELDSGAVETLPWSEKYGLVYSVASNEPRWHPEALADAEEARNWRSEVPWRPGASCWLSTMESMPSWKPLSAGPGVATAAVVTFSPINTRTR